MSNFQDSTTTIIVATIEAIYFTNNVYFSFSVEVDKYSSIASFTGYSTIALLKKYLKTDCVSRSMA